LSWWQLALLVFENFSWVLLIFPLFHLMLIFPDGKLLSPRWRYFVVLESLMVAVMLLFSAFSVRIGPMEGAGWTVANPIGFLPMDVFEQSGIGTFWAVGLVTLTLFGVLALVLRFRRAETTERLQIKWMTFAVAFFGLVYPVVVWLSDEALEIGDLFLALSINLLAVAIAFGVLKYRLFDIDRFISRTVGYSLVVGLLAGVYAVGAIWLPSRLAGESPLFVAGSTLAVAALFNPVRRGVLRWVDRRFYRSPYDTDRLAEDFGVRLRDQTDVVRLTDDWMAVVTGALSPSSIGVWVRGGDS
jgi:hypothetical protein